MSRSSLSESRRVLWLWALVPLASLGIAGFVPPIFFAVRYGRRSGYAWSSILLAAIVAFFAVYQDNQHGLRHGVGVGLLMIDWVGGAAIAGAYVLTTRTDDDPVAIARLQRRKRAKARALIAKDPKLALDAAIGRPDLGGTSDDGGLVDVNRCPATTLARLPGIGESLAQRIAETRDQVGGYSSLADLVDTLNLNPRDLDDANDRLVFIPL